MRARGRCGGALHIQSRMRAILAYAAALLAAAHAAAAATHVARAAQLDVPVREPEGEEVVGKEMEKVELSTNLLKEETLLSRREGDGEGRALRELA